MRGRIGVTAVHTRLMGEWTSNQNDRRSWWPIHSHQDMNYFVVDLDPNTEWEYSVPATHEVAWAFVFQGAGRLQRVASQLELMVLGDAGAICVGADETPVRAIVGSGRRHPYPLVLGQSSIHTSEADLRRGEAEIERIGRVLREQRRIP